jgi:hypothetical protein
MPSLLQVSISAAGLYKYNFSRKQLTLMFWVCDQLSNHGLYGAINT